MLFGRPLKKDVGPGIDEEASINSVGRPSRVSNAIALIDCLAEFPVCGKTVLQVAAHRTRCDGQADRLTGHLGRVAISALQIDRHRQVCRAHDPAQIFDRQGERKALAVGEADLVAPIGGDEFCILQASRGDPAAAEALAREIVRHCEHGHAVRLTVRVARVA